MTRDIRKYPKLQSMLREGDDVQMTLKLDHILQMLCVLREGTSAICKKVLEYSNTEWV